jgi:hypothetical protein
LCGANGGLDRPFENLPKSMSCSRTETKRQILSEVLLSKAMPGLMSPVKCGSININEPMPMITAPEKREKKHFIDLFFERHIITLAMDKKLCQL